MPSCLKDPIPSSTANMTMTPQCPKLFRVHLAVGVPVFPVVPHAVSVRLTQALHSLIQSGLLLLHLLLPLRHLLMHTAGQSTARHSTARHQHQQNKARTAAPHPSWHNQQLHTCCCEQLEHMLHVGGGRHCQTPPFIGTARMCNPPPGSQN